MHEYIDGATLKKMIISSAQLLEKNKQSVDALNVFPVPDGDTGTNMSLTMVSAVKELKGIKNDTIPEVVDALSRGALKGARGNSGVILSQLFRGFSKRLKEEDSVTTKKYAEALKAGVDTAYKAVMKPVEGTILTVARVTAEEARQVAHIHSDFEGFFEKIIEVAKDTLDKTPELLPVLKQAGVVDSGGMGLLYIMMGASHAINEDFDLEDDILLDISPNKEVTPSGGLDEDIEFGYCTEFFIKNIFSYVQEGDLEKLKDKLAKIGDSIVVVGDEELIKIHVHTNMPGKVLQLGLRFGELSSIKIDNMREQHRHINQESELQKPIEPKKQYGILSVCMGDGIANIFKDLSVDYVIEGGQTMNPSTDDILKGIEKINASEIFVLPNNSNIIMSAKQAAQISQTKVHVIPTKTIPQGLAAMIAFNPDADVDTNIEKMSESINLVKTGQVTYAVRDSIFDGMTIRQGDIIGITDGKIVKSGEGIDNITKELLRNMIDEDSEIITLLYGSDVKREDAEKIMEFIDDEYPDVDVELYSGGQPLYYYIISVE